MRFPWSPFHRVPVEKYLRPSFFGKRTAVHHASIGCPFRCSFCGVHATYGTRERFESPERTAAILSHLATNYGADSVQFYDMNFFLREDHARDLADRLAPLGLRWWCEARVDVMSRYSDATLTALRRAGCTMIFFGAESGSNWALQEMKKGITTEQTLQVAGRMRNFGHHSGVLLRGGQSHRSRARHARNVAIYSPDQATGPRAEIIIYHYTPVPQRGTMYGEIDGQIDFPDNARRMGQPNAGWTSLCASIPIRHG